MRVLKHDIAERERMAQADALDQRILGFMRRSDAGEAQFQELALALFDYQFRYNAPYQRYCRQRRVTPESVEAWERIPAVSAASFGDARLATFAPAQAAVRFESSGTTREGSRPSHHELENTLLYDASLLAHFRACVMPDRDRMPMVLLSPSPAEAPRSSLAYMLGKVWECHAQGGGFFIRHGELRFQEAARV